MGTSPKTTFWKVVGQVCQNQQAFCLFSFP